MAKRDLSGISLAAARLAREDLFQVVKQVFARLEDETAISRAMTDYFRPGFAVTYQKPKQLSLRAAGEILEFVAQRTRWKVIHTLLQEGEMDGPDLQREVAKADIDCSPPAFSKHIHLLIDKGYVRRKKLRGGKELDVYELNTDNWKTRYVCSVIVMSKLEEDEVLDAAEEG